MEEIEVFKPITGYENLYEVSNYGNVKSLHVGNYGKISKLGKSGNGYLYKSLYLNGNFKSRFIQRFVAETFIPNPENKPQVNHKDGNKLNTMFQILNGVQVLKIKYMLEIII